MNVKPPLLIDVMTLTSSDQLNYSMTTNAIAMEYIYSLTAGWSFASCLGKSYNFQQGCARSSDSLQIRARYAEFYQYRMSVKADIVGQSPPISPQFSVRDTYLQAIPVTNSPMIVLLFISALHLFIASHTCHPLLLNYEAAIHLVFPSTSIYCRPKSNDLQQCPSPSAQKQFAKHWEKTRNINMKKKA